MKYLLLYPFRSWRVCNGFFQQAFSRERNVAGSHLGDKVRTVGLLRLGLAMTISASLGLAQSPPLLATVADSINPGTSDYLVSTIDRAEDKNAAYVIFQIDTPGGLLNSTRTIVQKMLNTRVPVVVFIGPRGAHAGSAGALITFAADVAAMAPGTNIGAAHPVEVGSGKMDKKMSEKVANDVAAFAESLAKTKGRNTDFAIRAVKMSESITAEKALKEGVVDLIADDIVNLRSQLQGFKFRVSKQGLTGLPPKSETPIAVEMTIKQRVVSFLSDPNIAYLIMTLGGLCIWVELSHPGLIFPGVLGALCIIISLVSFQALPIRTGALALILVGMALSIAELFVPSFGILGVGGIVSFIIGSLFLMDTTVPEFQISPRLIIPITIVLGLSIFALGVLVAKARRLKLQGGLESLIGDIAEVREPVSPTGGLVFVQGELWRAHTDAPSEIPPGAKVKVISVEHMKLLVRPEKPY